VSVGNEGFVGLPSESWIRTTRNGQSFGKYAQSAFTDRVKYIVFGQGKQKDYVMRKLTPTLTQSGLLAVLLQRQHYKVTQLAWRRARRKHIHAALWNTLTWPYRALTAPTLVRDSAEAFLGTFPRHVNLSPGQ
jgi:hypothetical protein